MAVDDPLRYPKLTPEQKNRILAELQWQYQSGNLRPVVDPHQKGTAG